MDTNVIFMTLVIIPEIIICQCLNTEPVSRYYPTFSAILSLTMCDQNKLQNPHTFLISGVPKVNKDGVPLSYCFFTPMAQSRVLTTHIIYVSFCTSNVLTIYNIYRSLYYRYFYHTYNICSTVYYCCFDHQ